MKDSYMCNNGITRFIRYGVFVFLASGAGPLIYASPKASKDAEDTTSIVKWSPALLIPGSFVLGPAAAAMLPISQTKQKVCSVIFTPVIAAGGAYFTCRYALDIANFNDLRNKCKEFNQFLINLHERSRQSLAQRFGSINSDLQGEDEKSKAYHGVRLAMIHDVSSHQDKLAVKLSSVRLQADRNALLLTDHCQNSDTIRKQQLALTREIKELKTTLCSLPANLCTELMESIRRMECSFSELAQALTDNQKNINDRLDQIVSLRSKHSQEMQEMNSQIRALQVLAKDDGSRVEKTKEALDDLAKKISSNTEVVKALLEKMPKHGGESSGLNNSNAVYRDEVDLNHQLSGSTEDGAEH